MPFFVTLLSAKEAESPAVSEVKADDSGEQSEDGDVWEKVKNFVG